METETEIKVQHTPGPWKIGNHQDANHYVINPDGAGNWIAVLQQNGEMLVSRQEANARLIAAAPTMYDALEQVYVELLKLPLGITRLSLQHDLCMLRDSLAKARGESEESTQNHYEAISRGIE